MAEPGRGLSKALSGSGAVPPFVAEAASRALAERVLYDAFRLSAGIFTISPGEPPPELPFRFDRSTGSLVLEALRRLPAGRTFTGFSVVEPRSRPILHPELSLRYQVVALSPEEGEALARVDGTRTAEQVSPETRVLARLAAVGLDPDRLGIEVRSEPSVAPTGLASLNVEIAGVPPPPRLAETAREPGPRRRQHVPASRLVHLLRPPRHRADGDATRRFSARSTSARASSTRTTT